MAYKPNDHPLYNNFTLPELKNKPMASKITKITKNCMAIAVDREGIELVAYKCPAGVWTIGIGTTRYPNGMRVKEGDTCTVAQAFEWLEFDMLGAAKAVDDLTVDTINQNQFDALADFVYNKGVGNYRDSTLRQLVNANQNDPRIDAEFKKWVYGGGKKLPGLAIRAEMESELYFRM